MHQSTFDFAKVLTQQGFTFSKKNLNFNPQFENSRQNEAFSEPPNFGVIKEQGILIASDHKARWKDDDLRAGAVINFTYSVTYFRTTVFSGIL